MDAGLPAADILDKGFVKGIEEVGDLFGRGEFFLPDTLTALLLVVVLALALVVVAGCGSSSSSNSSEASPSAQTPQDGSLTAMSKKWYNGLDLTVKR